MNFVEPASEAERFRRIGELIGRAVGRGSAVKKDGWRGSVEIVKSMAWELVSDELDQRILRHLAEAGASSPSRIGRELNLSHSTLVRRLKVLRFSDLVTVSGKTRRTEYQLSKRALSTD
jgi:hypothetical protein